MEDNESIANGGIKVSFLIETIFMKKCRERNINRGMARGDGEGNNRISSSKVLL